MKKQLTPAMLDKIAVPKSGRSETGDSVVKGLAMRVTVRGTKSWSFAYRVLGERGINRTGRLLKGVQHRVTIGTYPAIGVADAREKAVALLKQALAGSDPRAGVRAANSLRYGNTLQAVAERMIEDAKQEIDSWEKIEITFRHHVFPRVGKRPIADLTRADIAALLDEVKIARTVATAREVRKHLSRLFSFAHDRALISSNPMAGMRRKDLRYVAGNRVLSDDELKAVWLACDRMGYPYGPAYRLLLLTGQRKREWLHARWSWIDRPNRTLNIPAEAHKSRRGHVVPIPDLAWQILDVLPRRNSSDYIFIGDTGSVAEGESKTDDKLRKLTLDILNELTDKLEAKMAHFTVHDFRRTVRTQMAKLGIATDVCEAVLGHAKQKLNATYNHYEYLLEKRDALARYERHLTEIVS
jgi:integrase